MPQGSEIASWLYKAYIHYIPKSIHTLLALYADDTTVIAKNKNIRFMHKQLQDHINKLENFFTRRRIEVIPNKSKTVFFSRKKFPPPPLTISDELVHFDKEVRYLGVILDSNRIWCKQIENNICKFHKAKNDLAYLLYSNDMSIGKPILLYKTVLRPILIYCAQVWDFASSTNTQILQTAQNKTLRAISHAPWYKRFSVIHYELCIESIRSVIKSLAEIFYNKIY